MKEAQKKIFAKNQAITAHAGCPGSKSMQIQRSEIPKSGKPSSTTGQVSNLQNWPVQIKLAPVSAPYFNGAKLLIAADCTAYAYASFHQDFIRNKVTLIGCPKLDQVDYSEKLTADYSKQRYSKCDNCKNGSSMLWRSGDGSQKALQNSEKFIPGRL